MKKHYSILLLVFIVLACDDYSSGTDSLSSPTGYYSNGLSDMGDNSGGDRYNDFEENPFVNAAEVPVSTFSIDADGGSYANIRRFINEGHLPPKAAVRTEELINYFALDYPVVSGHPIGVNGEVSDCPWKPEHKLIRIGIKGETIPKEQLPPSNLVLLIDVSGSMSDPDKLELLKKGFKMMVDNLAATDRVAIVTYAGSAGVPLTSTLGNEKEKIKAAIDRLGSGGSTAGAQGIITAYQIAQENFIKDGNNRVILGTDGDFNVGPSSQEELVSLIETKRDAGVYLTVIGVGRGNLNDGMMEQVADHGNGHYEYIDDLAQAQKVFVDEFYKFYPAAKDVKVQVKFNTLLVEAYRLIGYENRLLQEKDFEDDKKDAGEISLGQNVTALYEIKPASAQLLRTAPTFTIEFRYKRPNEDVSHPLSLNIFDEGHSFTEASDQMRFTASVAGFGMLLRGSAFKGSTTYANILDWTSGTLSFDPQQRRAEFRNIVKKASQLN
jgi:Ca-activated chloride channel homolog